MAVEDESGSNSLKSLSRTRHGKVMLAVAALIIVYVAFKYFRGHGAAPNNAAPAQDGTSGSSGGSVTSGGTDTAGTGGNINSNVTPNEQLSQWFSSVEGKAIAANPNDASQIDATLADLQNNVPLTQGEQKTWQDILSQFGAPPFAVGGQQDIYSTPKAQQYVFATPVDKQILLDAGVPMSQLVPYGSSGIDQNALFVGQAGTLATDAGMNVQTLTGPTRVETRQLVDNLLGVSTSGNSIASNNRNPSNSNITMQPQRPLTAPSPVFNPNAVPQKVGAGYVDPNANVEGYSHLSSFQGLTPGTALFYEPTPGTYEHISSPGALQNLAPGTPIYVKNH